MEWGIGCCCSVSSFLTGRCLTPVGDGVEVNRALTGENKEYTTSWTKVTASSANYDSWCNMDFLTARAEWIDFNQPPSGESRKIYLSKSLRCRIFDRPDPGGGAFRSFHSSRSRILDADASVPAAAHCQDDTERFLIKPPMTRRGTGGGVVILEEFQIRVNGTAVTGRIAGENTISTLAPASQGSWFTTSEVVTNAIEAEVGAVALGEALIEIDFWYSLDLTEGGNFLSRAGRQTDPINDEDSWVFAAFAEFEGDNFVNPTLNPHPTGWLKWDASTRVSGPFVLNTDFTFNGEQTFDADTWTRTETDTSIQWELIQADGLGGFDTWRVTFDWGREVAEVMTEEPDPVDSLNQRYHRYIPTGVSPQFYQKADASVYRTPSVFTPQASQVFRFHSWASVFAGTTPGAHDWGGAASGPIEAQEVTVSRN